MSLFCCLLFLKEINGHTGMQQKIFFIMSEVALFNEIVLAV